MLPGFAGSRVERSRNRMHASVIAKVHELWPPREAALIDAMIIGEEAFIDRDTRVDFHRSGTYHILVVSGMNVSILAFVVFWTLRRLRIGDVPATLLTVASCAGYAFITEVGAPVWRATLMCAVYLGTRLLYRDRAMTNALAAAAFGLLVFDPRQLFTASIQMTFLCVLIVSAIGIPMLERTSQLYRHALANWDSKNYAALLPPRVAQFRLDLQMISAGAALFVGDTWAARSMRSLARFFFAVWDLLFISAVMQAGLALPMAYYFHRATTIGLPANLIVVPLTQLMMPAAVLALALGYVSVWLAKLPVLATTVALNGITGTIQGLGGLHLADLRVGMPSAVVILLAVASLVLAMWTARRKMSMTSAGLAAVFVASLALAFVAPSPRKHSGVMGTHRDRCRRGRLHSRYYSDREYASRRCRRSHWPRRLATRLRRRRGLVLLVGTRFHPLGRGGDYAWALRSHRRHDLSPEKFPAERIVGGVASAESRFGKRHFGCGCVGSEGRAPLGGRRV